MHSYLVEVGFDTVIFSVALVRPHLSVETGFSTIMCLVASNLTSLSRWASALPRVL
jgi:hypothetical protein